MSDEPERPEDPTWIAMVAKPATRSELLHVMQMMVVGQLSQSVASAAFIDGDEALQRELAAKALEVTQKATEAMRSMIDRWKSE